MPRRFLTEVLGQSEHAQQLIEQAAKELFSVNAGRRQELANDDAPPETTRIFNNYEVVTSQLQDASRTLVSVIQSLRVEIRDRTMVDHQLAAAVEQEEGSRNAALHDNLTGLPNRVLFRDRLEHGIAQAKRHRWMLAVMFIDLDDFKTINDTYGHETGDAVLRSVAMRLRRNTRDADTVSRFGGDEFLYLLNQVRTESDISMIAAKVLKAIQAPWNVNAPAVVADPRISASVGISVFPRDGTTASALIKSADQAMYAAKMHKSGYAFAQLQSADAS